MAIHMIARLVPDGSTVRFIQRRTEHEGLFQHGTLHIVTRHGAIPVQRDTLLEVVRFPGETLSNPSSASGVRPSTR